MTQNGTMKTHWIGETLHVVNCAMAEAAERQGLPIAAVLLPIGGKRREVCAARLEFIEWCRGNVQTRELNGVHEYRLGPDGHANTGGWRTIGMPDVARLIGAKDHTTVLLALRRLREAQQHDSQEGRTPAGQDASGGAGDLP